MFQKTTQAQVDELHWTECKDLGNPVLGSIFKMTFRRLFTLVLVWKKDSPFCAIYLSFISQMF